MERDDLKINDEYAIKALHSDEHGKEIRKNIVKVTLILSLLTIVEVLMGVYVKKGSEMWEYVKVAFILMTLVKAGYIVLSFMHLGDEKKFLRYVLLIPYCFYILYVVAVLLYEAVAMHTALLNTIM